MRDRLAELLSYAVSAGNETFTQIADYLIANGVIVPPCKVGQRAYCIIRGKYHCQFMQGTILRVEINKDGVSFYVSINGYFGQHYTFTDVGKNVFFTREEAERALKGGE